MAAANSSAISRTRLRVALGAAWALLLGLLAPLLWQPAWRMAGAQDPRFGLALGGAVAVFSGACFIFLVLVADALCPRAARGVKRGLKLLCAGCWVGALLWTAVLAWRLLA